MVTEVDGTPHVFNQANVKMPSYIVARPWLAEPLQRVLTHRRDAKIA